LPQDADFFTSVIIPQGIAILPNAYGKGIFATKGIMHGVRQSEIDRAFDSAAVTNTALN
jgi:hypothetical protein